MRITILACTALSLGLLATTAGADPPSWQLPPITIPPVDVGALIKAAQSCPPVEIAPGIFVPIPCAAALPKPPDDAPTVDLQLPPIVPLAVDLRAMGMDGPVKDQKQTGVCFAFAVTTVLESSLRRQGRSDVLSPLHFVAADGWDDLWKSTPKEAIALESTWPYDPVKACRFLDQHDSCEQTYGVAVGSWKSDPTLVAERDRASHAGVAWVGQAHLLKNRPVDQIVSALASGREVYLSVDIDSVAWGYRGVKNGVLPEYGRADRGGHAVVLVGYRTLATGRQFLIHNSWGAQWGEGGYAWISEDGLRSHLLGAQVVDARPASVPPVVTPAPVPVATSCPSGLAPLLGVCWL
jgi:hypothetical protein